MIKIVDGVEIKLTDAEIAEFNARQPTEAQILNEKWQLVRIKRNDLLAQSDWVVTKASDTGVAVSDAWKNYRQALRDVPTQTDAISINANSIVIDNIIWPAVPS
tara:strand:+ start:817 stop:1128 length:312 start_codon:yes stop_codon:yes gene_type:complete